MTKTIRTWQERVQSSGRITAGMHMQMQLNQQYMQAEINELRAAHAADQEAIRVLEQVEWNQPSSNSSPSCPWCGNHVHEGHTKTCKLKAALAATKGE